MAVWSEREVLTTLQHVKEFLDGHRTPMADQLFNEVTELIASGEVALKAAKESQINYTDLKNFNPASIASIASSRITKKP